VSTTFETSFVATDNVVPLNDFNPLNAELNPICHLLVLLGDLAFMGPCFVSVFQYTSNKMQRYTVYLYQETAVHFWGGTSRIIRSAEELEPV
jgi:hypothetical protein